MLKKILHKLRLRKKEEPFTLIWGVVSGPYHRNEVGDPNIPRGAEYMLVCKVEVDGQIAHKEYWFPNFKSVSNITGHFYSKIEPIKVMYEN